MTADRREWDRLADQDALWAVHTASGSWREADFFATGDSEVDGIMAGLAEQGIVPERGHALDFGCGVGRLTRALARHFAHVTGVDHSPRMIERARAANAEIPNAAFVVNDAGDLARLGAQRFDLVLTLIALQHVSSPRLALAYLFELARVCAPGGVLVAQVPERVAWRIRLQPGRVLNAALRRSPVLPRWLRRRLMPYSMRLVAVPEPAVRAALTGAGLDVLAAFPDARTGTDAAPSRVYVARRP